MLVLHGYKNSNKVITMNCGNQLIMCSLSCLFGIFLCCGWLAGWLGGFCLILVLVFCISLVFQNDLFPCNISSSEISASTLVAHTQILKNNFSGSLLFSINFIYN